MGALFAVETECLDDALQLADNQADVLAVMVTQERKAASQEIDKLDSPETKLLAERALRYDIDKNKPVVDRTHPTDCSGIGPRPR